jgi:hypothetical protein
MKHKKKEKTMRRLFHLEKKSDNSHKYYGSLSALCNDNADLGVSKFTLDRFDFEIGYFENANFIIRKSVMKTTSQIDLKKEGKKNIKKTSTNFKSKRSGSNGA